MPCEWHILCEENILWLCISTLCYICMLFGSCLQTCIVPWFYCWTLLWSLPHWPDHLQANIPFTVIYLGLRIWSYGSNEIFFSPFPHVNTHTSKVLQVGPSSLGNEVGIMNFILTGSSISMCLLSDVSFGAQFRARVLGQCLLNPFHSEHYVSYVFRDRHETLEA